MTADLIRAVCQEAFIPDCAENHLSGEKLALKSVGGHRYNRVLTNAEDANLIQRLTYE